MDTPEVQTTTITVNEASLAEISNFAPILLRDAQELEIKDEESFTESLAMIDIAIDREQKILKFFEEPTSLAFKLHRSLTSRVKFLAGPYQLVQTMLKNKRQRYRDVKAAEDRAREEELRKVAKQQADDAALVQARELEKIGEHKAAEAVLDRAASIPAPAIVLESSVPKQAGTSIRKVWTFRIIDPSLIPEKYKTIDESAIRKVVQALHDKHEIPGVEAYEELTEAFRRAK